MLEGAFCCAALHEELPQPCCCVLKMRFLSLAFCYSSVPLPAVDFKHKEILMSSR